MRPIRIVTSSNPELAAVHFGNLKGKSQLSGRVSGDPGNSTHAPAGRKIEQATGGSGYPFIDKDGSGGIICLDVCEDGVTIR